MGQQDSQASNEANWDPDALDLSIFDRRATGDEIVVTEDHGERPDTSKLPAVTVRPRGRYPWQQWVDGEWHTIRAGKDFYCAVSSMRSLLYQKAREWQIGCTTTIFEGELSFRYYKEVVGVEEEPQNSP